MRETNDYFKGILIKILDSYAILENLTDNSTDLQVLKIEMAKTMGFFTIIHRKLRKMDDKTHEFSILQKIVGGYLENYDFSREIDLLLKTYSEDQSRVKNIKISILRSLKNDQLIEKIYDISKKL